MTARARFVVKENRIDAVKAKLHGEVDALIAKAAMDMQAQAKRDAPVDTGFLKNSITSKRVGDAAWEVEASAAYAAYVEFGTHRMAAQPYMTPAFNSASSSLREAIRALGGSL